MTTSLIKSNRGKDLLVFENFTFYKTKVLKSEEVFWRCIQTKCSAKVFTIGSDLTVSRSDLFHNHQPNEKKLNRKIVSNSCKRKAVDDISEKPSKIIRRTLANNLPATITTTDISYIRKNMYNCRRKLMPSGLPSNIQEVQEVVQTSTPQTSKGECFLFINCLKSNIILFSCETNIRVLTEMDIVYMDGTFSYCTKYFLQLFTIHGLTNGHYIPLLYCLLPNKNTKTYMELFSLLKSNIFEAYKIEFYPKIIYVDFEKAIHNGIVQIWPNTEIKGCRFHLHQAWYRKIQSLGLTSEFKTDSEIGKWLKHIFGLTYLNPKDVEDCFVFELMAYKPQNAILDKFADYLVETYVDSNAIFPPHFWAEGKASISHSTNACESFHSHFNSSFYNTHPSIYIFIEKIKEFQVDTYVRIQSRHIVKPIKDRQVKLKLKNLQQLILKYESHQIGRIDFVKCVSHYNKI